MLLVSLSACESEPITDISKIEKELKAVVKDNGITKCSVIVYDSNLSPKVVYSNTDFSISNGSLVISGKLISGNNYEQRYNLLYLSNYVFSDNYISFYFSNVYN
jgi:hypothetical protein